MDRFIDILEREIVAKIIKDNEENTSFSVSTKELIKLVKEELFIGLDGEDLFKSLAYIIGQLDYEQMAEDINKEFEETTRESEDIRQYLDKLRSDYEHGRD
ncbi:hypothetical protein EKK58_12035 [Candidatus Dependentiae bacterium]|nr:MAG: hypothetical protein EKK58_12035 [Candidatus Dependentiae bacterium]